jgi:hypothetical protein
MTRTHLSPDPETTMSKFLIVAYDRPGDFADLSPADMQRIVERYVAWTDRLRAAGKLERSAKLKDGEGRILRGAGQKLRVTDGPYAETKEVVGGFWVVEAADYDEAVRLSADCPHLEFGTLSVRALDL